MRAATAVTFAIAASIIALGASAHRFYQAEIPNGANVPGHAGLGHVNSEGGGSRNSFGNAFKSAGLKWTVSLCLADSDGDGQSNGLELGDPCCTWTKGATPNATTDVSDPTDGSKKTSRAACANPPASAAAAAAANLGLLAAAAVALLSVL